MFLHRNIHSAKPASSLSESGGQFVLGHPHPIQKPNNRGEQLAMTDLISISASFCPFKLTVLNNIKYQEEPGL